ncbi:two-component regulator propeller domain-containing protein [Archangium sp.]|uniref:two-component regulator propeller domain-containing protein n=1 Tax=Archangium sp. TaxID=1872627 RepID=UPI00286B454B|nr:two-component regulator propeller domain-containing protein [Archangium sp.]
MSTVVKQPSHVVQGARLAGGVVLLLAAVAFAQTPPGRWPLVEHAAETLGSHQVRALAQDARGFLWIGTTDGLFRYDGSRLEPIDMGGAFVSRRAERLAVTPDGGLWCVTPLEARRWLDGRWLPFPTHHQPPGIFHTLATDPTGRAWITTDAGLFQEQPGGGFQPVPGWPGKEAAALWIDERSGDVYVTAPGMLYRRRADGSWKTWGQEVGLPAERLLLLGRDADERLWVFGGYRLLTVSLRSGEVQELHDVVGNHRFDSIQPVPWGGVWIGTNKGLLEYDGRGPARPVPGGPLWVTAFLLDREGSLWTGGQGIQRLAGLGQWRTYTSREGLPSDVIFAIRRDPQGRLWVGTLDGVARTTAQGWELVPGLPRTVFTTIVPDEQGHLWLGGTQLATLFRYGLATGELTRFALEGGKGNERVRHIAFDRAGTLWAATTGGLFRSEGPERRLVHFPLPGRIVNPILVDVLVDSRERLWVAGGSGLAVLEQGQWRRFSMADGLRQEEVLWLTEPQPGRLCVAYGVAHGVDCFRYEQGRLENVLHLDMRSGLTSDNIVFLRADSRGRLWMGSGRGVDRVGPEGVVHFGVAEGLPGEDCDDYGFWEDPDGSVWIGTSKGLGHFRESPSAPPSVPLQVILTRVQAGEQRVMTLEGEAELPHERNTLEFDWASPTFTSGRGVVRQVRLEGLEPDFREEGYRARYVGLPPRRYEFQARARRPHEASWGPVTRFAFVIHPPWWLTWWFRVALATVVVGALGALARWRQHALRARNAQLERLVEQRTRELTQAQEQLVRVEKQATEQRMAGGFAHEMRNALTGAKLLLGGVYREDGRSLCVDNSETLRELFLKFRQHLPAEQRQEVAGLLKRVNVNEEQLDGVLREVDLALGRALGTTHVLLDYARTTRAQPGSERVRALVLAESLVAEYREDFARHEISVELEVGAETVLRGSEAHFLSMLKNLWLNARDAVLDKPVGQRRIRLAIREQGQGHVLEVEDSGTGIAPEHRQAIFEPFFSTKPRSGTGLGLSVVQRLTSLYRGTISLESTVGVGTRFTLLLPHTGAPVSAADAGWR